MDALMIPIVQAPKAAVTVAAKSPAGRQNGSNFSDYMEKKMAAERRGKDNLLGLPKDNAAPAANRKPAAADARQEEGGAEASTIAALLAQFIQDLQQAAGDHNQGAGQWSFPTPDPELLAKTAQDAGMNESQLTTLLNTMKDSDGKVNLVDFLATFTRHFQGLQENAPVSAPETDLPLLELIFERLGVPVPEVSKISNAAVRVDSTIDLEKILAGLQGQNGEGITDLTPLEAEQLQDLLAAAGVSQQLQRALFPERVPVIEGLVESGPPMTLTLDRLKNMLEQAIGEVKGNRLTADPIAFLTDLKEVLVRSGFEATGPSLSSAVHGSVVAVFEKLMESVDFAKVKVQPGSQSKQAQQADAMMEKKNSEHWQEILGTKKGDGVVADGELAAEQPAAGSRAAAGPSAMETDASGELFSENNAMIQAEATTVKGEAPGAAASTPAARPFVHIPNMPPGLQQQSFVRISEGVLQGLRNQEHHLILRLYPKELGEVKVEMTVRDNQVAVSFAMENTRVKEVLESNLEQFKENMEKQGFTLGECMVSLNKDSDGNEAWQQFQAATFEKGAARPRTTLADLPDDILYQRVQPGNGRENGVDLFA